MSSYFIMKAIAKNSLDKNAFELGYLGTTYTRDLQSKRLIEYTGSEDKLLTFDIIDNIIKYFKEQIKQLKQLSSKYKKEFKSLKESKPKALNTEVYELINDELNILDTDIKDITDELNENYQLLHKFEYIKVQMENNESFEYYYCAD